MSAVFLAISLLFIHPTHDVSMSVFRVSESTEGLRLQVNFDRADYEDINGLRGQGINQLDFQDYLNRTTSWIINGTKYEISVKELSTEQDHLQAVCTFDGAPPTIQNLKLHNEFLLAVEDQSNVIMLEINGKTRGFRMHEARRYIEALY